MRKRRIMGHAAASALVGVLLVLVIPTIAHADILDDISGYFSDLMKSIFVLLITANGLVSNELMATDVTNLTTTFSTMLGADNAVYVFATNVHNSVIRPVSYSILSAAMILQLYRASARIEGGQAASVAYEIIRIIAYTVLFLWLINHSAVFLEAIFDVVSNLASQMAAVSLGTSRSLADKIQELTELINDSNVNIDLGVISVAALGAGISFICSFVARVMAQFMIWSRAVQIYAYMMIAPVPLSMLGFEQTRSIGIGFLKNFVALSFTAITMVFLMLIFPVLSEVALEIALRPEEIATALGEGNVFYIYEYFIAGVALNIILISGLKHSGSWTKDMFGG